VKLGVDTSRGACIGYFSASGGPNLLNNYDNGRFVAQSYYGDPDGSSWDGTPWVYNPVQGGGYLNQWPSATLAFSNANGRIYARTRPRHWATGAEAPEMIMEQWITLKGTVAHIHYRMTYSGAAQATFRDQEVPAVFTDYALSDLVFYGGSRPWLNEALTSISLPGQNPVTNSYTNRSEHWAAVVDPVTRQGLGVYTPETSYMTFYRYSGGSGSGPTSPRCSYFAPVRRFNLESGRMFEYDVFLLLGSETGIRSQVYAIRSNDFDADNDSLDDRWEYMQFSSLNVAGSGSDFDRDGAADREEFAAGSDSTDANDRFRAEMTGNRALAWNGSWHHRYVLEQSTNLPAGSWMAAYTNASGNPALNAFLPGTNSPARFFRVQATPGPAAMVRGWPFDQFGPGVAWRPSSGVGSLLITNGALRAVVTNTPTIVTDDTTPLLLDAASFPRLAVRLKNQTVATRLRLRWLREGDTGIDSGRTIDTTITANDGSLRTYDVVLSTNTNWSGSVKQLRVSLVTPNPTSGSFEIDYLMLYRP